MLSHTDWSEFSTWSRFEDPWIFSKVSWEVKAWLELILQKTTFEVLYWMLLKLIVLPTSPRMNSKLVVAVMFSIIEFAMIRVDVAIWIEVPVKVIPYIEDESISTVDIRLMIGKDSS